MALMDYFLMQWSFYLKALSLHVVLLLLMLPVLLLLILMLLLVLLLLLLILVVLVLAIPRGVVPALQHWFGRRARIRTQRSAHVRARRRVAAPGRSP